MIDSATFYRALIAVHNILTPLGHRFRLRIMGENSADGWYICMEIARGTPRADYARFLERDGRFQGVRIRVRKVEPEELPEEPEPIPEVARLIVENADSVEP